MVREAAGELQQLSSLVGKPKGHSIQARIYAEDCLQQFRPSAGQLDHVDLSPNARNETWVRDGLTVTTLYDPMLAKIIVHGKDRAEAIQLLIRALEETRMYGITTNLQYLQELLRERDVVEGHVFTQLLNGFEPAEHAIEVVDGGIQSTVQDYPGRIRHWDVGVPPCGPMDPLSFRIGNKLLGNPDDAPGLELTLRGGAYKFRSDMRICITGADMLAELDGVPVQTYKAFMAAKGQVLSFGEAKMGMRAYLLIEGGLDMPRILGSASTFTLGGFGGHGGRALRPGDVLGVVRTRAASAAVREAAAGLADGKVEYGSGLSVPKATASALMGASEQRNRLEASQEPGEPSEAGREEAAEELTGLRAETLAQGQAAAGCEEATELISGIAAKSGAADQTAGVALPKEFQPVMTREWTLGVIPGPHCTGEFLKPEYLQQLTEISYEVHFNSSRTGVRLKGPAPLWTREDGGEAGLHPSNIHDNAYAIGTLDLTGDMPILLGPDGPSLGGFVCPVTTASAEFWKIGQLHPGDTVRFRLLTLEEAEALRDAQEGNLQGIGRGDLAQLQAVGSGDLAQLQAVGSGDLAQLQAVGSGDLGQLQVVGSDDLAQLQAVGSGDLAQLQAAGDDDLTKLQTSGSGELLQLQATGSGDVLQLKPTGAGDPWELKSAGLSDVGETITAEYPKLFQSAEGRCFPITIRCCGDQNLLVEYGELELDLLLRFQVQALMQAIIDSEAIPVLDLTPGIRSLQVHIDLSLITVKEACKRIIRIDEALPPLESFRVPSRIVRLPLSWDDPATKLAIERYQQGVRPDAPWCPSNLEFIRRINGLDSIEQVRDIVYGANYLVLGLGDVYLGAPVATPVDPRHRLVTTKYNPARTWTPENAVGIGGAYMCVYGMEGPGGYQFVGRTIQMWNRLRSTESFKPGKPWLLRFFDQIQFYPVEADELLKLREDFLRGRYEADITETTFDLGEYLQFLASIEESTAAFREQQQIAFKAERDSWKALGLAEYVSEQEAPEEKPEDELPEGTVGVRGIMPGSVWKVLVNPGEPVKKGDKLAILESMKMEFPQHAPCDGYVSSIFVNPGDQVHAGQLLVGIAQ
ncbi:carboxyltransferase domain-containing protein [Paenibacillus hexagrammi]|uniref:Carboxyltransferase domain-containing protein n=1 Tax=Paenibacillus hexagrammi TaxID=2908839 RepID=A0ABY3SSY9_9BACL|nr:carboxyltransferase domain-containing protein [Paenibacillus sp. YPD9-1]UJF36220.1 carboxyltransferase domain-containing protein [Paenibacillus sp. YPD9-1]